MNLSSRLLYFALAAITPLAAQNLKLGKPVVSQFEDGPPLSQKPVPGETIHFAFFVEGYKAPAGKVKITGHAQLFDPQGIPASGREEVAIGTSLDEEDKDFKPKIRVEFAIPAIAPGGSWRVHYDAEDQQSGQKQEADSTFTVEGHAAAHPGALEVRNLGFYRAQTDETPLSTVAYRAGDVVWVRFEIAGYKYGEQNAIDVSYDVAISNTEGKVIFDQQDAAGEKSQSFYPQPWVPAEFNLSLQSNMTHGTYTLTITAKDTTGGGQTAKTSAQFRVQ